MSIAPESQRESLREWLALLRVPGLGPARGARLLQLFGDPVTIFAAGAVAWRKAGVATEIIEALARPDWSAVDADLLWLDGGSESDRRSLIVRGDPRYPAALGEIAQAPLALFCRGDADLLNLPQLALVGARAASAQGVENAQAFAAELARRGLAITSGLALGIDAAAHRGALSVNGLTLAVCGNGLDRVYPSRNKVLAQSIVEHGLLVSEFSPGTPAKPENFPRRNRIISGLSLGVLVIEAARQSGSLITARLAAEQGREVFAIPGSIHSPLAHGCHALIRDGARLTETVDDILEELAPLLQNRMLVPSTASEPATVSAASVEDPLQARVLAALGHETVALEQLVERLGLPVQDVSGALLALELEGKIVAAAGDRFGRLDRFK